MSTKSLVRVLRRPGIHVVYGPPGSFKTTLSLRVGFSASRSKILYVGLARHSVLHPRESEKLLVKPLPNLKSEFQFLLELELLSDDIGFLIYDGFSSYFLPLRFYMRESSIAKIQLFAASKLYAFSQLRNLPVVITTQEVSGRKPLAYKVLRGFALDFTRVERTDHVVVYHICDESLQEKLSGVVEEEELSLEKG